MGLLENQLPNTTPAELAAWVCNILDDIDNTATIQQTKTDVLALCEKFPVYG